MGLLQIDADAFYLPREVYEGVLRGKKTDKKQNASLKSDVF